MSNHNCALVLARELASEWLKFERIMAQAEAIPGFVKFLRDYRGHASSLKKPPEAAAGMGKAMLDFFLQVLERSGFMLQARTLSVSEIHDVLSTFEQHINLGIYYWNGGSNRNFQFRTIVHFCGLEGCGDSILKSNGEEWYLSFSETGVRIGVNGDHHAPQCAPAFLAYGLSELNTVHVSANPREYEKRIFARVRTLQREICVLEEEWEHRNAIIAVEHGRTRAEAHKNPCAETQRDLENHLHELQDFRNSFAHWVLQTFVGVERWVSEIAPLYAGNSNVESEIDALDAVVTSGLQKIFLPAAVSRHLYAQSVAELLLAWVELRLSRTPDCLACHLMRDSARLHLSAASAGLGSSQFLTKKNSEWRFTFDPSSALKTFSHKLSPSEHRAFTAIATVGMAQKMWPQPLDTYWIENLASLAEMPNSYGNVALPFPSRELAPALAAPEILQRALAAVQNARDEVGGNEAKDFLIRFFSVENRHE